MELYYPGDEYVDWIGVSSFLKRDFMGDPNSERSSGLYFYVGDFAWVRTRSGADQIHGRE